jgi:UDP-glucose 4-epimerase
VLVTGGAGYLGYSVVGQLLERDEIDDVVVFDNLSRGEYSLFTARRAGASARFVEADILDGRSLADAMKGMDAVIHLAATVQLPTQDNEAHAFDQVNNWGSAQVAAAIEAEPSVTAAIYLSSVTVYGPAEDDIDTETVPQPNTFYGVTKLRGEAHLGRLASADRRIHIVRAGNIFGVNATTRFDTVINRFLLDGRFKRTLRVMGTGAQTRSFIEVDRLATAIVALLCSEQKSGTHNFVDHIKSVAGIADAVRQLAPGIEQMHVDQDMRMLDARVLPSETLSELVGDPESFEQSIARSWGRLGL